jgi:hypothetical protein
LGGKADTNGTFHVISTAPGALTAGVYQHVALTYDKTTGVATLYINGVIATQTNLGIFTPKTDTTLTIGQRPPGSFGNGPLNFFGAIDEVSVYNRALSPAEIQAIYNTGGFSKGGNLIQGNFIGTNAAGSAAIPNGGNGITITNSAGNTIGGTTAAARNVISGNAGSGILITGSGSTGNVFQGNFIGTDATGTMALGNASNGVQITSGATGNTIGGTAQIIPVANYSFENPVLSSGNFTTTSPPGWTLSGLGGVSHLVVGTEVNSVPDGVQVGYAGNTVGGGSLFQDVGVPVRVGATYTLDVYVGSRKEGYSAHYLVELLAGSATIGSASGTVSPGTGDFFNVSIVAVGSGSGDLRIRLTETGSSQTLFDDVRLAQAGAGNLISGNLADGVDLANNAAGNMVQGNYIGTNAAGTGAIPNGGDGVLITSGSTNNTIGGATAGAGNVISGNAGNGIDLVGSGTSNDLVQGNIVGLNAAGNSAIPNVASYGVFIRAGATNNTIGGTTTAARNILSGNGYAGVGIYDGATSGNLVQGNYIGTDITGSTAVGNSAFGAVIAYGASGNTIGGTTAGARNIISGNNYGGIDLFGSGTSGNLVQGNYIGTAIDGATALPNLVVGVFVRAGVTNNTIGGTTTGERNVISGNGGNGVWISDSGTSGNVVQGNYIGTDVTGTVKLPNSKSGVLINNGASGNTIGGASSVDPSTGKLSGAGNLISGNLNSGIQMEQTTGNVIQGNFIGTDATGEVAMGNDPTGFFDMIDVLEGSSSNTIGGVSARDANGNLSGLGNLISGYTGTTGVWITNATADLATPGNPTSNNLIEGNFVGTDVKGTKELDYGGTDGVVLSAVGSNDNTMVGNTIGGLAVGTGNLISDSGFPNLVIRGAGVTGSLVVGNLIGTNAAGTAALGTGSVNDGIDIGLGAHNNTVGGTVAGARNIISGNAQFGVSISSGATANLVQGNYIGTDITGTVALGNASDGIRIGGANNNTIGGSTAGAGNLISGNQGSGVDLSNNAAANVIQGNFIGTNAAGTAALGNSQYGVYLNTASVNSILSNTISGNASDGIEITGNGAPVGAVGWWKGDGNANDSVGTNNGTLQGGATFAAGLFGQAFSFNGNGQYVSIATGTNIPVDNSPYTLSAWFNATTYRNAFNAVEGIVGYGNYGNYDQVNALRLAPDLYPNTLGFRHYWWSNDLDVSTSFSPTGSWYHVTATYDGTYRRLYLNGAQIAQDQPGPHNVPGASNFAIGLTAPFFNEYFHGLIEQVSIFNRALSSSEIQSIFQLGGASLGGALIQGNFIGTNAAGTAALGNLGNGIQINASADNTIGGATAAARNIISGNAQDAVLITGSGSTANVVEGNYIGTDSSGTVALANGGAGVLIEHSASNNTIGGTVAGTGNIIAFNGGAGVAVGSSASDSGTVGNSIRGNSIYSNAGLGIDLGSDGVTLNHSGAVSGPNNLQNFPVLVGARPGATTTEVAGSLTSLVNTSYALDFYANTTADPSGYGQGKQYLGSGTVMTDVNGMGNFDITLNTTIPLGVFISATATDPNGNTSEFAKDIPANRPPTAGIGNVPGTGTVGIPIPLVGVVTDPDPGETFAFAWSVSLNGSPYSLSPNVATTEQTFIFTPGQTGSYQVSLVVSDSNGGVSPTVSATIAVGSAVSPAVQITAPISSPTNQFLTLTSTVSEPTSGVSISSYAWNVTKDGSPYTLPAGTVTNAASFTFAPTPAGNYVVSLTASDSLGRTGFGSVDILVFDSTPAALIFVAPGTTAVEGTPITLSNQITSPTLSGTLTYNWTITENGSPFATETDTIGTFTFVPTEEGIYGVSLVVSNGTQIGTAVPVTLTITNATPVVTIANAPQSGQAGTAITLQGSASDADPKVAGSGSTDPYALTWTALSTSGQAIPLGSGSTFSFVPTGSGVIDVTLTATDEAGLATSTSVAILITQIIRTVTVTPPSNPQEGTPFIWIASVTPPGSAVSFAYNWTVTAPDGSTHTFTTGPTGSISTLTYNTLPILPGTYQVSVTISGNDGSTGTAGPPSSGTTIVVANAPPSVAINVPPPPNGNSNFQEGDSITLSSSVSDLGVDLSNPTYSWTVTGPDNFSASGVQSSINFIPTELGAYTATLSVTDANKGVGTATQTINVAHLAPTPILKFGTGISNNMISLTAAVPDPGAEDLFTYTVSVNGQLFFTSPPTGPSLTFDIPLSAPSEVVTVAVTDSDSGSASDSTTIVVVPANTTKNLTSADVGGSTEILAVAQGQDTVSASGLPGTVTAVLVANGGQDTLIGGAGPNILQGDTGSNMLQGGSGPNTLIGTGSDTLMGGSGNNLFTLKPTGLPTPSTINLSAGSGTNTIDLSQETSGISLNLNTTGTAQPIDGSSNQAVLSGQYQTVMGSPNADQITATSNATVFGGGGNDTLMTAGGSNILLSASSGNAMLMAQGGSNVTLLGGKDSDTLTATGTSNATLIGGSGSNDSLSSTNSSNVTLFGGSGSNDTLASSGSHNVTLFGGSGSNDSLSATNTSNVTLFGGSLGNDSLMALGGFNASLFGNSGSNDSLSATNVSNVTLIGGSGSNDSLAAAGSSNVTLIGGSGSNDSLAHTGGSNVTLFGGSGSNDTLSTTSGFNVTLLGGSGSNDSLAAAGSSNITLIGGSGSNDTLSSSGSHNVTLFGGSGSNDSLSSAGNQNVTLFGGSGSNDTVSSSGESNITLIGGSGSNDSLSALNGSNVTLFGGSGSNDSLTTTGSSNITLFGGSGSNDSLSALNGSNVTLFGGSGSNDSLTTTGSSNITLFGGSGSNDSLAAHGSSNITLIGGSGSNDTLSSSGSHNVTLFGGSGSNDSLATANGSNITLIGGSGSNDSLSTSGDSNITLIGGSGSNDSLGSHSSSNITLIGGSGSNDTLSASGSHNVTLIGGSGSNDSLASTGSSNLTLLGGSGSNDTVSTSGDSNVTLIGGSGSNDSLSSTSSSNVTLFGGSGSNDTLSSSGSHNVTLFGGSGSNDSLASHGSSNITLIGGSGSNDSLSTTGDTNITLIGGSGSNDSLASHSSSNITLIGGSGSNDTLSSSGSHNITLFGGSGGNDSLTSANDSNGIIYGGSGSNDTLASMGSHNVTMIGGSGSNDSLSSSQDANVTLIGGSMGNHTLTATNSTNVYLLGDLGNNDRLAVSNCSNVTMVGGSGNFDSLSAANSQNVFLFGGSGNNDTLTSTNDVNVTLYGGSGGNDSLTSTGDTNATLVGGTGSNDTLNSPTGSNVTLFGGSGNFDSLTSSGDTNATVVGGSGGRQTLTVNNGQNITLINGGNAGDTFIINGGMNTSVFGGTGDDTLVANGGSNIGLFGENGNKTYQLNGSLANPLSVTLDDLATSGLTQSFGDKTTHGINTIAFPTSIGLTIDLSRTSAGVANPANQQTVASGITLTLVGQFEDVIGTPGNNYIQGNAVDNVLTGGGGNDTLIAGSGNATLVAGTGNDSLVGGSGNDTYLFKGANLGNDTITTASNTNNDTIDLSQLAGGPTMLNLASTAAQTVNSNLTLTLTNANVANVIGSPAGNTLTGNSRGNQFTLNTGNNTVTAGTGFNTFFFTGSQLGSNSISNPAGGTDALNFHQFGGPISVDLNQSTQSIGGGTIAVNALNVVDVVGTPFSDVLKGDTAVGAPSVSLIGGGGLDSLVAGSGNDYLQASITQVVLLDFDSFATGPGEHVYPQAERDAIQQRLANIYADFSSSSAYGQTGVYLTQSFSDAQSKSRPTGGQYFTLDFNRPPEGGLADEVNWRHVDLASSAGIDVNPILGSPNEPAAATANYIALSAGIAAHELGHLFGLRHADSFGPIGSGIFLAFDNSNNQQVAGPDPTKYHPTFLEPPTSTPVQESNFLSDSGLIASATVFAPETSLHVMASPDAAGTTRFDTLGNIFFDEREAVKLAFDDTGTTVFETAGYHQSFATAQALGGLPSLVVPNTLLQGVNYGRTFQVGAVDVIGNIGIDNNPQDANFGKSKDDYYSFVGHQGDLLNFAVFSNALPHNAHPMDSVLKIFDAGGNLVAYNDDEFETRDSAIIDFTLPAAGLYYAVVDTFTDGTSDAITGNYQLFMYSFATTSGGAPQGGGSTLVAGNGQDLLLGSTGNDLFTFVNNAAGSATIMGGNGADLVDETPAPHEAVTIVPPTPPNSINVKVGVDTTAPHFSPLGNQSVAEGSLLHFKAQATDDPGDVLTFSIRSIPGSSSPFPAGAVINPITGGFNWDATDEGTFAVELVATDTSRNSSTQDITITVTDAQPRLQPIANQSVTEGTLVSLQGGASNPAPGDTYSYGWTITLGGQTVTTGMGQSFSFTPGDEGIYTATFKVTDVDDGTFGTTSATITVSDVAPAVQPIPAQTVNEGTPASYTGSFADPGTVDSQLFDWHVTSTNSQVVPDGTSQNFTFTPNDNGTYTITFTVQDADGGPSAATTTTLTVLEVPPTATLSNNGPVNEGSPVTVSFSNPFDPSSADTNAGFHYSFAVSAAGLATSYAGASSLAAASLTFAEEGSYVVYARILDKDNAYTDYTTTVTVNDPPVTGAGGFSINAAEGKATGTQTVATFTDSGGPEVSPTFDYKAAINWGDNTTSTGAITLNSATGVFTVQGGHLYAEDGSYNITVSLNHDNSPSVTVSSSATVSDPGVLASGGFSVGATEGITTSLQTLATFTDPGGPEVLKDYSASIAWGDGQNSTGTISLSNGLFTVVGSHQYLEQGSYSITITLGHDNSTPVTLTDTASVSEAALSAAGQNFAVAEGTATGMITIATFTDLGGPEVLTDYSASIAWGDNSSSSGASVVIKPAGDGKTFLVQANHTYAEEGTDPITVTLGHESAPSLTVTATATVSDPAVVGTGVTLTVNQGVPFNNQAVATFVDPGGPEALTDYSATINWGDNSTSSGTITLSNGTFTVSGSHLYTQLLGSIPITITLTHDNAPSSVVPSTVVVAPSIFILNPTQSGALTVSGSSFIHSSGNVVVDSNSSSALMISGTSQIIANQISVVGGVSITGTPTLSPAPTTHVPSLPDPLASLPAPSATGLVNRGSVSFSTGSHTLLPGIYTQIKATNSASLLLNPGTYVIKGGGLAVSGAGSIAGSGVFIYNAGSNFPNLGGTFGGITISNSGTVSLTAATTGPYANILIFQSRDNPRAISFSGSVVVGMSGEIYAPNALLSLTNSAALKLPVAVNRLTVSGAGTSGLTGAGSSQAIDNSVGELVAGDLVVYVNDPAGFFTADDLARIQDTIHNMSVLLAPYHVTITEVDAGKRFLANVVIDDSTTTPLGGQAQGILGAFTPATGEITLVQGWNFYAGATPAGIGRNQYDFEILVTHELGHALGLGHSPNPSSVMYESLAPGTARRLLTSQDLNIGDPETIPGALTAANSMIEDRESQSDDRNSSSDGVSSILHLPTSILGPLPVQPISNLPSSLEQPVNRWIAEVWIWSPATSWTAASRSVPENRNLRPASLWDFRDDMMSEGEFFGPRTNSQFVRAKADGLEIRPTAGAGFPAIPELLADQILVRASTKPRLGQLDRADWPGVGNQKSEVRSRTSGVGGADFWERDSFFDHVALDDLRLPLGAAVLAGLLGWNASLVASEPRRSQEISARRHFA